MADVSVSTQQGVEGSFEAETAVKQYMAVKEGTSDYQVKPLGSGDTGTAIKIVGIAQNDADAGEWVRVKLSGPTKYRAGGTITRGQSLVTSAYSATANENGKLEAKADLADGDWYCGRALMAAADKDYAIMELNIKEEHGA